ncbi:MAG: GreA/GreB family elongation factor [Bacteroidota bacterium]|nr:GreA/GreB family elongation factor [Bacteroidota bacterium]
MKLLKPIISQSVYKILRNLVRKKKALEAKPLNEELLNAQIVKDDFLDSKIVSLNSIVEFIISSFKKPMCFQIVLPEDADLNKKKISILSPIATALIGFKEADHFTWKMPSGVKNIKILKVYNAQ